MSQSEATVHSCIRSVDWDFLLKENKIHSGRVKGGGKINLVKI